MSPEMLVSKWRTLFSTKEYQQRLVGLIIDKAHCVIKWYAIWNTKVAMQIYNTIINIQFFI